MGYSADAEVILEVRPEVLRPTAALREGNTVLRLGSDEVLEVRAVQTGIANWEFTEITAGLEAGDRIVTSLEREGVGRASPRGPTNRWRTGAGTMAQIELEDIERIFHLGGTAVHRPQSCEPRHRGRRICLGDGPIRFGQTTLLNLLGLLDRPDAGATGWWGRDVTTLSADERARVRSERIGFVFQSFHLVPRLSAAENIALPLMLAGGAARARIEGRQALADFGLEDRSNHRPDQLSGGQRQRVAIARATIMRRRQCCSPTSPPATSTAPPDGEVTRLLEALNANGVTLIVVTHDPVMGDRAARRVLMADGAIEQDLRSKEPVA